MARRLRSRRLLALLALAGCGPQLPATGGEPACAEIALSRAPTRPGVVLIVNDAMRRDRVGIHGGSAATPNFDAFARENLWFERAVTQSPWTKPSVATLFTSLYPSQHGVATDPGVRDRSDAKRDGPLEQADVLSDEFVTLAELFGSAGFRTAAFVSNPWLGPRFGFAQGFQHYDDSFADWDVSGEQVTQAALAWLGALGPEEPFFVYLHYIDTHRPYGRLAPAEAASIRAPAGDHFEPGSDGDQLVRVALRLTDGRPVLAAAAGPSRALVERAYDRGVENFDRALGSLLRGLRGMQAWERTAVIVTSDHGEALFTRGYGNHGLGLYDDEASIPLAVRLPGTRAPSARIECLVGLVDVMPSLCAYLDLACPASTAGWSFVSTPRAPPGGSRRYLVTEGVMDRPSHRAIRNRRYKLMYEPEGARDGRWKLTPFSLFDLDGDPGELRDRAGSPWGRIQARLVLREMERALPTAVPAFDAPTRRSAPIDPETRRRLEELGYGDE